MRKLTQEEVIARFREVHGDRYDYSKVVYIDCRTKVEIICKEHGSFWQMPIEHMRGKGCAKCHYKRIKSIRSKDKNWFIEQAIKVHGNKYDYSLVEYVNNRTKVCIICPIHGEFWQTPGNHLQGQNCPSCSGVKKSNKEEFTQRAIDIHGDKYDYSKVKYINNKTKVCIICKTCGEEFWQTPDNHIIQKQGCPHCYENRRGTFLRDTKEGFIAKAREIHGDKYDYSEVEYINNRTKVCIICPEHGRFWMKPNDHLNGMQGCPICKSSKGERIIETYLKERSIKFITQYKIQIQEISMYEVNNPRIDFYLPQYNTFIEFNGIQHYRYTSVFHKTEEDFQKQLNRDKRMKEYCKKNKINLITIKYNQMKEIDKILDKKLKL